MLQNGGRRARAGALILIYSWLLQWSKRAKNCRNISASSERGGNASRSSRLCTFRLLEIETATVDHFIAMIDWFCCLSYPRLLSWGTQIENNTGKEHPRAQIAVPLGMVSLNYYLLVIDWGEIGEMKDCVGLSLENFSRRAHSLLDAAANSSDE